MKIGNKNFTIGRSQLTNHYYIIFYERNKRKQIDITGEILSNLFEQLINDDIIIRNEKGRYKISMTEINESND